MYMRHHTTTRDEREFLSVLCVFFSFVAFAIQLFFSRYRLYVLRMNANVERVILRWCVIACYWYRSVCLSKFTMQSLCHKNFAHAWITIMLFSFLPFALNFSLTQRNNKLKFFNAIYEYVAMTRPTTNFTLKTNDKLDEYCRFFFVNFLFLNSFSTRTHNDTAIVKAAKYFKRPRN